MCQRVWYGVKTLTKLTVDSPYSKYLVVSVCAAVFLVLADPRSARLLWREQRLTIAFTILVLIGYGAAYSWYAVVSYGDRFILSLYLPIMFAITWCCVRLSHAKVSSLSGKWRRSVSDILALAILFAVLVEGVAAATLYLPRPNEPFVEFYFNESREAQMDGDIAAAVEGYRGVLQLEPGFGPAHHELAIVALQSGRADEAVQSGLAAVTLEPENANFVNTYGSALLQAERAGDAVAALQKAVDLNPSFASAWYNLAVAHLTLDDSENASHAILRLEALDPARAAQLRRFMSGE
jgi:hypothetical protein